MTLVAFLQPYLVEKLLSPRDSAEDMEVSVKATRLW